MKFLIIGLGSMGQRRIRCLQHLKYFDIYGYDIDRKKIQKVKKKYNIQVDTDLKKLSLINFDAMIISTDPKYHMKYAYLAFKKKTPFFIEASVTNKNKIQNLIKLNKVQKNLIYPSCTMIFNDSIMEIKKIINSGLIGKIYFAKYHVGQYLPDWHPWENIKNFYVGRKETNGCKELIPFELNWITNIFGKPKLLNSYKKKLSNLKIDFPDIQNFNISLNKNVYFDITIEIMSRPQATRELQIIGSEGKIILSFDQGLMKYKNIKMKKFKVFPFNKGKITKGYINSEMPYIREFKQLIKSIKFNKQEIFPHSLEKDYELLKLTDLIVK